jgi:predicted permease
MIELFTAFFRSLAPVFVLMMIGMGLRRMGVVGSRGTNFLSKAVILFFFPVLVFHRLASTSDPNQLLENWIIHVWAIVILIGSGFIGYLLLKASRTSADARTFVFLVAFPNWIYLPLALAGPIWGDEAVRLLILFNIPTQIILWTVAIWVLHGTMKGAHAIRYMLLNPGILSAAAGLLVAFQVVPIHFTAEGVGWSWAGLNPLFHFIGGLTIPLSVVALGLYLGERVPVREGALGEVMLVIAGRLFIAPVILIGLLMAATKFGLPSTQMLRWVLYLIIAMPVAVSAPLFAEMFNRDRHLAARGVVATTLVGLISSPVMVVAAIQCEEWLGIAAVATGP